MPTTTWFPPAALDWLLGGCPRVLVLGGGPMLPRLLAERSHEVFWAHPRPRALDGCEAVVAAQAEHLPFEPLQFDAVAMHNWLSEIKAGIALPQIARTLRPTGRLAVSVLIRDDSVPWVKRLIALLRHFDPLAMAGDYGVDAIEEVRRSNHYRDLEQRQFRVWRPISRAAMLDLVRDQPLARRLSPSALDGLLADVGALYDDSASASEHLKLPFQLVCWRAQAAHDEFTAPLTAPEPGLRISL
ncbi:MAG: SAM-dependent methyltransferase [Propionibacteriaceae bacterium]|nr:SAM-dependent methyltransferase [Propionibacteriaceae bacterium]